MAFEIPNAIEIDVRIAIVTQLNRHGYNIPVYLDLSGVEDLPTEYFTLVKTGSDENNYIYTSTFVLRSISSTMAKSARLNEIGKQAVARMADDNKRIIMARVGTDYPSPDYETKEYSYDAVINVKHY